MIVCRRCGASLTDPHDHDQPRRSAFSAASFAAPSGELQVARGERRPRTRPSDLESRDQRLNVRRAILCQVPGIHRVRAKAIVLRYPTISALMAASVDELEAIPVKESKLGRELAIALKRVFE